MKKQATKRPIPKLIQKHRDLPAGNKPAVGLYRSILSISRVALVTVQIQPALPATSTMGSTLPAAVEHRFMRFKVGKW
ncbi:hypothetical protein MOP89_08935 [Enterococcus gallinarum]|nr:hypothetical protein [Enterococcus gallinarum]